MNIVIDSRQRAKRVNSRLLKLIVAELLAQLKITDVEIGINLVAAREMALVNETFLNHAGSTDVITFDHTEKQKAKGVKRKHLHGELFVCIDDAILQAKQFQTSWQSEVVRYIVHGILHLLGHDDLKPQLRRKMKREENRLLRRLAGKFSLAQIGGAPKLRA